MPPLMMCTVAPLAGGVTPIMPIARTGMLSSVQSHRPTRAWRTVYRDPPARSVIYAPCALDPSPRIAMFELRQRPRSRACKLDGEDLLIVMEADVLGVIEPTGAAESRLTRTARQEQKEHHHGCKRSQIRRRRPYPPDSRR